MSDTILSGDFIVYYTADSGRKQIKWNTATSTGNTYRTANELYSALQDLFDELTQMDDGVPMSAQTPTEYTIGSIDASDDTPWFIDDETIQRIKGGAIKTANWTRITGAVGTGKPGIVKVRCSANTSIVYGDVGNSISNAAGSTGVLLDLQGSGANTILFIRPTDSTSTHDWSAATSTITCNGHTATSFGTANQVVFTGEALWANIYSLGSIATDKSNNPISDLYVYRNGSKYFGFSSGATASYQWWPTGHLDVLMKVKEPGANIFAGDAAISGTTTVTLTSGNTTKMRVGQAVFGQNIAAGTTIAAITGLKTFTLSQAGTNGSSLSIYTNTIDGSYVTVFAREYNNTYDYFTVDLNSGGRNPIPLATGDDLNNHTGIRTATASAGTGTFSVGEIIYSPTGSFGSATAKGVVTAVSGTGASSVVTYYLIGNLTDLTSSSIQGNTSGATITASSIANNPDATNPATLSPTPAVATGVNATPTAFNIDINNGGGTKQYAIQIDCKSTHSLAKIYEWAKYITRRGASTINASFNSLNTNGEAFIGPEYRIQYTGISGGTNFASGDLVFQASSGAFGIVVTHDTATTQVILKNTRGTFLSGASNTITNGTITIGSTSITASSITPIKACPFGTFAGGKFFAATGVYFTNLIGGDAQNYQYTALDGTTQIPPNTVSITINKLITGDSVGVYRTSNGVIIKDRYTMAATSAGATSLVVTDGSATAITGDEPSIGFVRVVKNPTGASEEHRYRYSSVNTGTKTFTLTTVTTGQQAALTATAAQYWNSGTNTAATGGNLIRVTLGTAISTSEVFVGDMVYTAASGTPTTPISYGAIVKIEDTTHLWVRVQESTVTLADWSGTGNVIVYNKAVMAYTTSDKCYVPFIDSLATTGSTSSYSSLSNTLIYSSDIPTLARVRQFRSIQPFEANPTIGSTGVSADAVRTPDSIAT